MRFGSVRGVFKMGLVIALVAGSGCASAERIHALRSGMTAAEVSDQAGDPETIRRDGERLVWFYRTDQGQCAVVFNSERSVAVDEAGRVASWACSGDAVKSTLAGTGTEILSNALALSAISAPPVVFMH